jgi:hypothetical protein
MGVFQVPQLPDFGSLRSELWSCLSALPMASAQNISDSSQNISVSEDNSTIQARLVTFANG